MTTTAPTFPSTIPDLNDPSLHTPQADYAAVIVYPTGPAIAPSYHNLSHVQQRYILALWRAGEPSLAQRVAGCYRSGTVFQLCPKGAYARGYKHRCGDPLCATCSRPRFRFYAWAAKRDHTIFTHACTGLEFFTDAPRETAIWQVREFLRLHVGPDAVMSDAFDGSFSVRCVVPMASMDRKTLQSKWKACGNLSVKHADPSDLYMWAFGGMVGAACLAPEDKAALRISLKGARLVRTIGGFYKPLPKSELARRRAESEHNAATCPVCKDHELETLTLDNRRADSVESIESTFDQVEWTSEHESAFSVFLVRRGGLTNKLATDDDNYPAAMPASHAPPG